jgi:glycosyltransferase 2 family protein
MPRLKNTVLHPRAVCVLVTVVALFLVFRRVQSRELLEVLRSMRPVWFLAAILLFGLLFVPASCRWHLALRLGGCAINLLTTARISLIGHFFYTILFGAAGGDIAKSALYSRSYHLPLPRILAASSLDRLLGFGGFSLFVSSAFALALLHDGYASFTSLKVRWSIGWILLVAVVIALGLYFLGRTSPESIWKRFTAAFGESGRKLIRSPRTLTAGIFCGFLVQLALGGVLALNLQAVSHSPLPWLQLAWTFPVITIVSALPITIAGLGVRESAALFLFGLCHVPASDAIAASLLTATASLMWTLVGGILFWREALPKAENGASENLFGAKAP